MSALRLYFTGIAENYTEDLYINYAVFVDPEGNEVCLDRCETYWGCYEDNIVKMLWRNCYDIEDETDTLIFDESYMDTLVFDHFVFEDEAPLDYDVQCSSWDYECY